MHSRDKIFLSLGTGIALAGIVSTIVWSTEAGVIALLILAILILTLLILQRKQLARVQERSLKLLKSADVPNAQSQQLEPSLVAVEKKLVGLLQAQQIGMDRLNDKVQSQMEQERRQ